MELKSYFAILTGNKWVIITTVVVTVAVTLLVTLMITPIYTASTTLRIASASSTVAGYSDYMYADRLMNTYTKIATSGPVLKELAEKLNLKTKHQVKVEIIPNTELIKISVESSDPTVAKNAANTLAGILINQGKELYTGGGKSAQDILAEQLKQAEDELNSARKDYEKFVTESPNETARIAGMNDAIQLKERTYAALLDQYDQARLRETIRANIISVVEPAGQPLSPSRPNKVINIGLGFLLGLTGGVGLAFLFENFSNRLYTTKQIEAVVDLTLIGKIPNFQRKLLFKWMGYDDKVGRNIYKEAFRQLLVKLGKVNVEKLNGSPLKTILITSSEPGEGKSTITANLAIAMAQSGKNVIVVDCDLHIPKQHKINRVSNNIGLSSILKEAATTECAIQTTQYPGLDILTSGPLPSSTTKFLESTKMKSIILYLANQYDMVLLDSPALLAVADTTLLTSIVDGVVLVVRRNYIREEAVREAYRHLLDVNAPLLGFIVNDAESNGTYYYYH